MTDSTIHLAHDWLVGLRGGERVLDRLARLYGPTKLYTLVNDGRSLTDAIDSCNVVTSPLQCFPGASGKLRRWYLPLMPWAVGRLKVKKCDLLISTSSSVMKSIKPPKGVPHICYCHSPARYIWGQTDDYSHGKAGGLRSAGLRMIRKKFQKWDKETASRVTKFLANSKHTAKKIKQFYDRDSEVVYPPVRTNYYTEDVSVEREDYYLIVSALEPYKRVDLAIDAANRAGFQLKVVGSGSQLDVLRASAGSTVEMLGRVDDDPLRDLYRRAKGLIHPQLEDFGIIAVEAQACGCPVIAFAGGGALETVGRGCGTFFNEQTIDAVVDAIGQFEGHVTDHAVCRINAMAFSEQMFDDAINRIVDEILESKESPRIE